ncbi:hypothetical protein PAGU1678_22620 [Paraclostridium bifermentans subsp. muricolitidis]|nr:hypothetical protein PAGU1678_22620 [Paraclostridium bifermentans subsp. muricolitidis]
MGVFKMSEALNSKKEKIKKEIENIDNEKLIDIILILILNKK